MLNTMAKWSCVTIIIFAISYRCIADKIEVIEETGCPDSEFRLTCARLSSLIAILSAGLYPPDGDLDNSLDAFNVSSDVRANAGCPRRYSAKLQRDLTEWFEPDDGADFKNLRAPLNNRCSGKNHCSFKLYEDHRNSEQWGPGQIRITYACMAETSISRLCSASLKRPSGFIMSPGYPGYYVGGVSCSWTIAPPPGLQVQLSLLDVSLREITQKESICTDSLTITDHTIDRHLVHTCGEKETIATVRSQGHQKLTVTLYTRSKLIYPKRGFLIYYKVLGCQLPALPKNVKIIGLSPPSERTEFSFGRVRVPSAGFSRESAESRDNVYRAVLRLPYVTHVRQKKTHGVWPTNGPIVHREAEMRRRYGFQIAREKDARELSPLALSLALRAVYRCSEEGYVFPDSLIRKRDLVCVDGTTWNSTLPDCINITGHIIQNDISLYEDRNLARAVMMNEPADMISDILVPSLLILGLFVVNAIVLFIIYRFRKRKPEDGVAPEELPVIASSSIP